jgi:hypothetical protein
MTYAHFILQCIKQGSTLRVSPKKEKPTPRIVYRYGTQKQEIRNFLQYRKIVRVIGACNLGYGSRIFS